MITDLLIDEITAVLDGEDDVLDSSVGLPDLGVYACCTGGGGNQWC